MPISVSYQTHASVFLLRYQQTVNRNHCLVHAEIPSTRFSQSCCCCFCHQVCLGPQLVPRREHSLSSYMKTNSSLIFLHMFVRLHVRCLISV